MLPEVILAFDQASRHLGWAMIDMKSGRAVLGGYQKGLKGASHATKVVEFAIATCPFEIRAIALEDVYLAACDTEEEQKKAFRVLNVLAELRGRILQLLETRWAALPVRLVHPWNWQADINAKGLTSFTVKRWSQRMACSLVDGDQSWLNEDSADAVHIGRRARGDILEEDLEEKYGPRQKSLGLGGGDAVRLRVPGARRSNSRARDDGRPKEPGLSEARESGERPRGA